jgi:hypothetical protein
MNDATFRYLIQPSIKQPGTPYVIDYARVLELTKQLTEKRLSGNVQDAFDVYVGECMTYLCQKDFENTERAPAGVSPYDNMLLPPRTIAAFVKRKKR